MARRLFNLLHEDRRRMNLAPLIHRAFWDKKIRIALLTLATFAALC
jgi:hypothetical protein